MMKGILLSGLFVFSVLVALSESYPNSRYESSYDEKRDDLATTSEPEGLPGGFNPLLNSSLSGFVQSMQAMMKRVQAQMGEVLSRLPPQDIDWGKLGNTTSHAKVINDHIVTVNETTYRNTDPDSRSVLHVRIVDVKPSTSTNDAFTQALNRHRSLMKKRQPQPLVMPVFRDGDNTLDSSVDVFKPISYDLSRDTLVNRMMSSKNKGGLVMMDPDAEWIDDVKPVHKDNNNRQMKQEIFKRRK